MGRNGNGAPWVGDTMMRHARRRPCPQTHRNAEIPPFNNRPTNRNNLPRTPDPRTTTHANLRTKEPSAHRSSTRQPRTRQRRQQQKRPNDERADHKAANTPMHQPNSCSNHDATSNRPQASRPTWNQPGMQGSIRERRPTGWRHHGEPGPPTTIPTDMTEYRNTTNTQPTNLRQ